MTDFLSTWDGTSPSELAERYPQAVPLILAEVGQCRFPLWDLVVHEGRVRTSPTHQEHRLVCGSPTTSAASSYCRACSAITNTGHVSMRARAMAQTLLQRSGS